MLAEKVNEWTREWKREGLREGRKLGHKEGKIAVLLKQMEKKYGAVVTDSVRKQVESASLDDLEKWTDRILTAATLEEMFGR